MKEWSGFRALVDKLNEGVRPSGVELDAARVSIDAISRRMVAMDGAAADFWRQVLKSTDAFAEQLAAMERSGFATVFNVRDRAMADNLLWLRKTYPSRKIIVWAANFHLCHIPGPRFLKTEIGQITMGTRVSKALGDDAYNVGLTCYEGQRSFVPEKDRQLAPAPADSLEGLWEATGQRYGFLDVRQAPAGGAWLNEMLASRICSDNGQMLGDTWGRIFDLVLFLRTMEPNVYGRRS